MSILLVSMVLDYYIGDPLGWPHPVIYIGKLITGLEKLFINNKQKKTLGFVMVIIVLSLIYATIEAINILTAINSYLYAIFIIYGLYAALAYRSLIKASSNVYKALEEDDIKKARLKLSYIVGRDTNDLSKVQIIKATIETVAENTIDGIIGPIFFAIVGEVLFGKPVTFIWLYKGINTMDSMVGYMNEKYRDFGYAAAKLDDLANFIPARLGSLLMLISNVFSYDIQNGIRIFIRDRKNHKSPNSGHPESVVAGLLNIQLGGNSHYFGKLVEKPKIGDFNREVKVLDIKDAEKILSHTYFLILFGLLIYEGIRWHYGI